MANVRNIHEFNQNPAINKEIDLEEPEFERLGLKEKLYFCLILSGCLAVNYFVFSYIF